MNQLYTADLPGQPGSYPDAGRMSKKRAKSRAVKALLLVAGTVFLGLAITGVVIPLIPTTPFLLLAAGCYLRSSPRIYNWLLGTRWLGGYVRNYLEGRGIPMAAKVFSISLLWITIGCSVAFVTDLIALRAVLGVIAVAVTLHILHIRTLKR